jgi:hypothetical protein
MLYVPYKYILIQKNFILRVIFDCIRTVASQETCSLIEFERNVLEQIWYFSLKAIGFVAVTASVVWWPEFLATDPEARV